MKRIAASLLFVLALTASAAADLTNPCTLILKETSPSRFSVQLTLPVIQGRVLKARPILPDVCAIEGDADVQGDGSKVVRTWAMTCDPNDLVGTAIGVQGLLGTSLDVQLTIETLDGRQYVGQLRPTQAYYVVPPSPTMRSLAVEVGGAAVRQVLETMFSVRNYVILGSVGVGGATLVTASLVFVLSIRLRRREIETIRKTGGASRRLTGMLAAEILLVVFAGIVIAGVLTAGVSRFGNLLVRFIGT